MKQLLPRRALRLLLTIPVGVTIAIGSSTLPGGAAGTPAPAVLTFTGSPTTLPTGGGSTTISASIKYGSTCTLSVSPAVTGLPATSACSTSFSKKVALPKNPTGTVRDYAFSLAVKNSTATTKSQNSVAVGVGAAPPPISFNPPLVVLGAQGVGIPTTPVSVTITNNSTSQSQDLTQFSIQGTNSADFGATQSGNCLAEISAGQSCQFLVTFSPVGAGLRTAFIAITDTSWGTGTTVDYKVSGTGEFATVSLAPATLNFPGQAVRDPSLWTTVEVNNSGTVPLKITGIGPSGNNFQDFAFNTASNSTTCMQGAITPGASCYFQIQFTPLNAGARSTDIQIQDNTARSATNLPTSGTGEWTSSTLSASTLTFPSTPLFQGVESAVTITNTSKYSLVFGSYSLTGNDVNDFSFVPNPNQTGNCASSSEIIAPGLSCKFDIQFQPLSSGIRTATLYIYDNTLNGTNPGFEEVQLTGTGG